jgi:hypothetical protein
MKGDHSDQSFMAFPKLREMVTDPNNFVHKRFVNQGLEESLKSIEDFHKETIQLFTERLSVVVE